MATMTFKQKKGGTLKTIAIHAKRARGLFVDWLITNRVDSLHDCSGFNRGGYRFIPELSSDVEYVFMAELD
jgi:cytoplasmic iron level regulating protein YaaA (DUF328/UPF0246 family)